MLHLPLTIRYRELPQREPVAWLVPGEDAALWLEEWLRWELPQEEWRIAILPGWGTLTLVGPQQTPVVPPRAVPLGRVSARVYAPLHAELTPAITPEELEILLPRDFAVAVFHPGRGLLVVEPQELRTIADFCEPPPFRALDWTVAAPGNALNERLLSVQPARALSLLDVLEQGRGDIGSQRDQFEQLPPRPAEPGNSFVQHAGRSLLSGFAQALARMANLFAGKPSPASSAAKPPQGTKPAAPAGAASAGAGWLQAIAQWANNKLSGVSQQLEELRNKELHRLMHLLQTNPDEGLKFALPFNAEQHRGLATPGGLLGARDVNFNLGRIGGGGQADYWNVPAQLQQQLTNRYRELANRELQLGRHRRAAYIFAELLGDLDAAASALLAGEHWREAAVLYRDRLKRPLVAAGCLEKGGLLHEAIAIYDTLREYEKVGDLYQRLQQREDALQAWQNAAATYEGNREHFRAAHVMEEKIADPEAAAQVLGRSWLAGNRPRETLEKLFELFGRHSWHDRARQRIKELRDELSTDTIALASSEALATVVRTYPEREVTAFAADSARVLIGIHLPKAELNLRTKLVTALQSLVPADQLLQRDGQRYLREQSVRPPAVAEVRAQPMAAAKPSGRAPQLVREFRLPETGTLWEAIVTQGTMINAVGNTDGKLAVRIGNWQGRFDPPSAQCEYPVPAGVIEASQVAADPQNQGPLLIATGFGKAERATKIDTATGPRGVVVFDAVPGVRATFARVGVCYALNRAFFIEHDRNTGTLVATGRAVQADQTLGPIATTFQLCPQMTDDAPLPTHGRNDLLAVGYLNQLMLIRGENEIERLEFPGNILQIAGSAPFTRPRLAIVTTAGTYVIWLQGKESSPAVRCAIELGEPLATFTIGGRLVLVTGRGGEIYESSGGHLTLHSRLPWHGQPLAVLPTDEPDQFAIFGPNEAVKVFKIG